MDLTNGIVAIKILKSTIELKSGDPSRNPPFLSRLKSQFVLTMALTTNSLVIKTLKSIPESKTCVINNTFLFWGLILQHFRNHGLKCK
jgi:hypothetical protein